MQAQGQVVLRDLGHKLYFVCYKLPFTVHLRFSINCAHIIIANTERESILKKLPTY